MNIKKYLVAFEAQREEFEGTQTNKLFYLKLLTDECACAIGNALVLQKRSQ